MGTSADMSNIFIPATEARQWKDLLAEPEKHWKQGYSARALAHCWQEAKGFPPEVSKAFAKVPQLKGFKMLLGIPEHKVALPGGGRASQTDLWVLATCCQGLVSIAVEGKVEESFGPTIEEWDYDSSPGRHERLEFLCSLLDVKFPPASDLRYQLFHRTASAILEAKRFRADVAILLVHSFSQDHRWFEDYARFASVLGCVAAVGEVGFAGERGGVKLYVAWVSGDEKFLRM